MGFLAIEFFLNESAILVNISNILIFAILRKDRNSMFYYWTATDTLELTVWTEVTCVFGSGEIALFQQNRLFASPPPTVGRNHGSQYLN